MKKIMIIVLCLFSVMYCNAQKKIKFSTQNYIGLLTGSSDNNLQLQTINGISFNKWFTGVGAGIDWYYQRSIPVFLSLERGLKIHPKKNIYFSTSAGANIPWNNSVYHDWNWWSTTEMKTRFYWNAGLGYRISVGKNDDAVLLNLGFSNKFYKEIVTSTYPCLVGPCPENTESFNYNLRAVSIKLGYGF